MPENCIIRQFNGCDCAPGECRSYSAAMARQQAARDQRTAERTVQAKHNAWRAMLVALAVGSLCAFAGATAHSLTKMERQYQLEARI